MITPDTNCKNINKKSAIRVCSVIYQKYSADAKGKRSKKSVMIIADNLHLFPKVGGISIGSMPFKKYYFKLIKFNGISKSFSFTAFIQVCK